MKDKDVVVKTFKKFLSRLSKDEIYTAGGLVSGYPVELAVSEEGLADTYIMRISDLDEDLLFRILDVLSGNSAVMLQSTDLLDAVEEKKGCSGNCKCKPKETSSEDMFIDDEEDDDDLVLTEEDVLPLQEAINVKDFIDTLKKITYERSPDYFVGDESASKLLLALTTLKETGEFSLLLNTKDEDLRQASFNAFA